MNYWALWVNYSKYCCYMCYIITSLGNSTFVPYAWCCHGEYTFKAIPLHSSIFNFHSYVTIILFMCAIVHANYDWSFSLKIYKTIYCCHPEMAEKTRWKSLFTFVCVCTQPCKNCINMYFQRIWALLLFVWNKLHTKTMFLFLTPFVMLNIQQVSFFLSSYIIPLFLISLLYVGMLARLWKTAPGCNPSAESR